jgi:hypothetical protein
LVLLGIAQIWYPVLQKVEARTSNDTKMANIEIDSDEDIVTKN